MRFTVAASDRISYVCCDLDHVRLRLFRNRLVGEAINQTSPRRVARHDGIGRLQGHAEIAADPSYRLAVLLRASEALYLTFVAEPGEDELSLQVLRIIEPALPRYGPGYGSELKAFVDANRSKLASTFTAYGVYSAFASQDAYWLFSQPESLIVFERITSAPQALAAAVCDSEIQDAVRHLFAAWGAPMPDVV
jgi:hypothetical protein